jgi:hypothetical protein
MSKHYQRWMQELPPLRLAGQSRLLRQLILEYLEFRWLQSFLEYLGFLLLL